MMRPPAEIVSTLLFLGFGFEVAALTNSQMSAIDSGILQIASAQTKVIEEIVTDQQKRVQAAQAIVTESVPKLQEMDRFYSSSMAETEGAFESLKPYSPY